MGKILSISDAASLAIHSLAIISASKTPTNANQIAEITAFSKNHLLKVLSTLTKNKYLKSGRGPQGGYTLDKNPSKITLLEIYELIDGKIEMHSCRMHTSKKCKLNHCVFGCMNEKISNEFQKYLKTKTIKDISTQHII